MRTPTMERFTKKYTIDKSGCFLWIGATDRHGYGQFWHNGNRVIAHRFAFEHYRGPIPQHLVLDHLCRVHACVNPWHLEAVTNKTNLNRGDHVNAKKTHCIHGHILSGDNLRQERNRRQCRMCAKLRKDKFLATRKLSWPARGLGVTVGRDRHNNGRRTQS